MGSITFSVGSLQPLVSPAPYIFPHEVIGTGDLDDGSDSSGWRAGIVQDSSLYGSAEYGRYAYTWTCPALALPAFADSTNRQITATARAQLITNDFTSPTSWMDQKAFVEVEIGTSANSWTIGGFQAWQPSGSTFAIASPGPTQEFTLSPDVLSSSDWLDLQSGSQDIFISSGASNQGGAQAANGSRFYVNVYEVHVTISWDDVPRNPAPLRLYPTASTRIYPKRRTRRPGTF